MNILDTNEDQTASQNDNITSSSHNTVDILSGLPNTIDGHKVFVLGSADDYVELGIDDETIKVRNGDTFTGDLSGWRVSQIYTDNGELGHQVGMAPGSDSGRKVLEIKRID